MMTFPQILIDGTLVGGFAELYAADRSGSARGARRRELTAPSREAQYPGPGMNQVCPWWTLCLMCG